MKKVLMGIVLIAFVIAITIALHSVNTNAVKNLDETKSTEGDDFKTDVVITDSYFIQSTNEIYINVDNYIGKTIKMEGLVYQYQDNSNNWHFAVVRNSPGCCGNDGIAGLDVDYDNIPEIGKWVEVIGTIKVESIDNQRVPVIEVSSMVQKSEGKTFVTN